MWNPYEIVVWGVVIISGFTILIIALLNWFDR